MSDLPFLPLWVSKYEAKTGHLTLEEDGAYLRLLRICWVNPKCQIPADDGWIRRRMRVDEATYMRVVRPILDEFFYKIDGAWRNERLHAEWSSRTGAQKAKSAAGKKGGENSARKRREKSPEPASSLLEAERKQTASMPESRIQSPEGQQAGLADRIRDCLGPRAANSVKDANVEAVAAEWLAMGATEAEILDVVRRKTAARDQAPIRSLRALNGDIGETIANRRQPGAAPKFLDVPPGKAGACVAAIIRRHGQDRATAWLAGATWSDGAVLVASDFDRQRVEGDFGEILRAYEFDVEVAPPAKKTA